MRQKGGTAMKKMVCNNCFRPLIGIKNEAGVVRVCCPCCGAVTVASKKSRRVMQMEVIAPEGQEVQW